MIWPLLRESTGGYPKRDGHALSARMLVAMAVVAGIALFGASTASALGPVNDSFENALELEGENDEHTGSTFGATKQAGEPNHAGDPGGASVWFSWTAPRSENVLVQLDTLEWAGVAAIYRGSAVGNLQALASTSSRAGDGYRETRFKATAATTYHIAVDGYSEGGAIVPLEEGQYELEVHAYSNQTLENDAFATPTILGSRLYLGGSRPYGAPPVLRRRPGA
jgi:hypothetical protein